MSRLLDRVFALLFAADSPTTAPILAAALGVPTGEVQQTLDELDAQLQDAGPILLVRLAGGVQLATKPEFASDLAAFLQPTRKRLSRSLMEVLAVVAYKQPITATDIEQIRGVQSDYSLRALAERRLIREVGRKPVPGRPILWGTTDEFLHQFKMEDLAALPPVDEASLMSLPATSSPEDPSLPE